MERGDIRFKNMDARNFDGPVPMAAPMMAEAEAMMDGNAMGGFAPEMAMAIEADIAPAIQKA